MSTDARLSYRRLKQKQRWNSYICLEKYTQYGNNVKITQIAFLRYTLRSNCQVVDIYSKVQVVSIMLRRNWDHATLHLTLRGIGKHQQQDILSSTHWASWLVVLTARIDKSHSGSFNGWHTWRKQWQLLGDPYSYAYMRTMLRFACAEKYIAC